MDNTKEWREAQILPSMEIWARFEKYKRKNPVTLSGVARFCNINRRTLENYACTKVDYIVPDTRKALDAFLKERGF